MCTVQLPLSVTAAYVMRRVNRSQNQRSQAPELAGPDSVRRALFSDAIDHNLTARDLSTAFAEMQREASRRWNFDFSTDTPLQGRFEWYPVPSANNTFDDEPSTVSPQSTTDESSTISPQTTIDESTQITPMLETQSKLFSKPGKIATSEGNSSKRPIQRKLTDFMSQRKRTSGMMSAKSPVSITKSKVRKTLHMSATTSTSSSTR